MDFYNPYHFIPVTGKVGNEWTPAVSFEQIKRGEKPKGENLGIRHDLWLKTQHSGRIVCSVKLETPTVVGNQHDKEKLRTGETFVDLYQDIHGDYALPANSLRGMVASVAEALSQSALRVLEKETYSVRKEVGKGLSAIGIFTIFTDENNGRKSYGIKPLTLPIINLHENEGHIPSKWQRVFAGKKLVECMSAYIDGYVKRGKDENQRLTYFSGTYLDTLRPPCFHEKQPIYYWAKINPALHSLKVTDVLTSRTLGLKCVAGRVLGQQIEELLTQEQDETPDGYKKGILHVLGIDNREKEIPTTKKHEKFLPYQSNSGIKPLPISKKAWDQFCAVAESRAKASKKETITEKKLPFLPKGYIEQKNENMYWRPEPGELVYFDINDQGQVTEISYSSIWRKPIDQTIHEAFASIHENLVPWGYTDRKDLTPAECLFGVVEGGDKKVEKAKKANQDLPPSSKNLASRLRFSDAHSAEPEKIKTLKPEHEPDKGYQLKILSSPKPPSPAMYFQNGKHITKAQLDLSKHKPNGRKYYLPHEDHSQQTWESRNQDENRSQKVRCHLLDKGQTFYFHIDFDNLSNAELCLLQKALTPGETFRHRLGLGKPLGLGSVTVNVCGLFLIDRAKRYGSEDWDTQSRYAWVDPSAWDGQEAVALSKLYPAEAAALDQSLEKPLIDEDLSYIDEATLKILCTLGDPSAYHPVRYPFEGDNPDIETEGFKWFVSNDKKLGNQRQGLTVLSTGQQVQPLHSN